MVDSEVHKKQQIDSFTDSNNDFTLFGFHIVGCGLGRVKMDQSGSEHGLVLPNKRSFLFRILTRALN